MRVEVVFYAILLAGVVVLLSLQRPAPAYDPCRGLVMADCGR